MHQTHDNEASAVISHQFQNETFCPGKVLLLLIKLKPQNHKPAERQALAAIIADFHCYESRWKLDSIQCTVYQKGLHSLIFR